MAGIISNVDSDVQKLRKLKNEIENVKKALMGINIKVDIDIAKGLQSQLTSLLGQYDTLVDKIAAAERKIMLSTSRINKATEKIVQAQEQVSKPVVIPTQSGNTSTQTNTAETASIQAQAKAYDDLRTEINGILGTREENVKRMIDEMNAIRLINVEIKKINKSQGDYSSLSSTQQKRLEQLNNSLLTHKTALSEVRQALNNNAKLDNVAATSMNGLSQSLSRMRIAYRELTEEERNSPFGKELLASIQQADTKIKELDTTIGNHQRNVGNYGKQWNGLSMSIQQVGRELPSLAYGPKVFFSAISNNIPILADEIKRARTEYKLLKESGQSAIPVWKQVVSSLFSWQTVLTVGITLLTLYGDKVVDWVAGLFNAKNVMKPLVDIQQQLNDVQLKGVQNAQSEITKLELLYKATQNASKPIRERKKAVDELQKSYPDFFKNLSEEEILTGKAADAYARLTSSIIASARARAAQDKMTENAKKILENEAIKHHHGKYINDIYAPAWKTLEYMTFGDILYLYSSLKDAKLKEEIAAHYNIRNVDIFDNYMSTLRVIRNLCAHGHNIYDLKLQKRIRKGPISDLQGDRFHNMAGGLLVLRYILNSISTNRVQDLNYKLKLLTSQPQIKKIENIIKGLITFIQSV